MAAARLLLGLSPSADCDEPKPMTDPRAGIARRIVREVQSIEDGKERARRLTQVAPLFAQCGERDAALETWHRAVETALIACSEDADKGGRILVDIALSQGQIGEKEASLSTLARARDVAVASPEIPSAIEVLTEVAMRQRAAGDEAAAQATLDAAAKIVADSEDPSVKLKALDVERFRLPKPDYQGILRKFVEGKPPEGMAVENYRVSVLGELAAFLRVEDKDEALPALDQALPFVYAIPRIQVRIILLGQYAQAKTRLGDFEGALRIVATIPEDPDDGPGQSSSQSTKVVTLREVAEAMVGAGQREAALRVLAEAVKLHAPNGETSWREQLSLMMIARIQAEAGDLDEAMSTVDKVAPSSRPGALAVLSEARERDGDPAGARRALETARATAEGFLRNPPLLEPSTEAERRRFLETGEAPPGDRKRLQMQELTFRGSLVGIRARLGDFEEAEVIALAIPESRERQLALFQVAWGRVRAGDISADAALATIDALETRLDRIIALHRLFSAIPDGSGSNRRP